MVPPQEFKDTIHLRCPTRLKVDPNRVLFRSGLGYRFCHCGRKLRTVASFPRRNRLHKGHVRVRLCQARALLSGARPYYYPSATKEISVG